MNTNSSICNFFKDQTVLITGGTGLLGKLVVEKLLRSCEVRRIYLLIRPKQGQNPEKRFQDFFNDPCFDLIKNKGIEEKVHHVAGDCSKPLFGLSPEHINVLKEETTCFIHVAANVKFDQDLKQASNNVTATVEMLELAKLMPNLKVLVYTSTAYSNCIHSHVKEEFYVPPVKAQSLFYAVNNVDDDTLRKAIPYLHLKWPNTYIFTKCISESVIKEADMNVPVVVVRPAILTNTINEPIKGWILNANAYIGVMMAMCLGIVRSIRIGFDKKLYLLPADQACNCILAAASKAGREKSHGSTIYNIVGTPITCENAAKIYFSFYWKFPSTKYMWYASNKITRNKFVDNLYYYSFLSLTYLIDAVLLCVGEKRTFARKFKNINAKVNLVLWFTRNECKFDENNVISLWNEMSEEDKKIFNFYSKITDWHSYLRECAVGVRKYALQDPLQTLQDGKNRLILLFVLHYTLVGLLGYLSYTVILFVVNVLRKCFRSF